MRRFFYGVGLVMLIVCGIIMAVTFVERLPSNPTAIAAMADTWRRLLEYVPLFLPMSIFMGTLFASYNLTKSSESIIISSAGLSPYQMARPFLVGAALIGVVATTLINPYSVNLLRESSDNGFVTMNAKNMHKSGNILLFDNATIYIQNPQFKLTQRVQADTVALSDSGMSASNATSWDSRGIPTHTNWQIKTLLNPQTVLDRYLQPDQISFWQLPEFITKMRAIGVPVRAHLVQFWTLLFLPLTMVAMATLGVAFSQTRQRRNYSFGIKFGLGILTCFAVYFLINMFNALGSTGVVPALLATIAPPLIIIAASGVFITSFDTI